MSNPNYDAVARAFADWAAGGTGFYDLLAADAVLTIAGTSRLAGTFAGPAAFLAERGRPFMARFSAPPVPVVRHIWADGDAVAVFWDGHGTTRDGHPYANTYAYVFTFAGGVAVGLTMLLDMHAFEAVWDRVRPAPQPLG